MPESKTQTIAAAAIDETTLPVTSADGAIAALILVRPRGPVTQVLFWLPALGVAARHYLPFAHALAGQGVAVALHEWRGIGASDRRAARASNWGYRELLTLDIPASITVLQSTLPAARVWLGGHSLGGQLATLFASMHPRDYCGLLLVASGSPYWRRFRHGWLMGAVIATVPFIAAVCGYFPGRRIGFGGSEARGVMSDWARSARTGRYCVEGIDGDVDFDFAARLRALDLPVFAWVLRDDWLCPASSLQWLLQMMPAAPQQVESMTPAELGTAADHFTWMKAPGPLASRIAAHMLQVPRA